MVVYRRKENIAVIQEVYKMEQNIMEMVNKDVKAIIKLNNDIKEAKDYKRIIDDTDSYLRNRHDEYTELYCDIYSEDEMQELNNMLNSFINKVIDRKYNELKELLEGIKY